MNWAMLGFDEDFDRTAVDTRAQAPARLAIAAVVFFCGITTIPLASMLAWAAFFAVADGTLWIATDPRLQVRWRLTSRILRLMATAAATCAWVTVGALWWTSPGDYTRAVAVALLAGVLLYTVRGCHRSMAHMLAAGAAPALALMYFPFTGHDLTEKIGLLGSLSLLVAYAASSGMNAWRSHRKLTQTTQELVAKQFDAEAASIAKSEFLANMSHEIRTPLNGVLAMAHVLHSAPLPEREKEAARLICESGEMLERLLSDILDLAKVEAGQLEVHAAPFDAGELARSAAALCRPKAEEKGVRLLVEVDSAADRAWLGDAARIRQVLINLLSNAVKFTAEGEVRLTGALVSGALRFSVSDTGVGFDPALKARLFERFQQADGSITRRFGGTGLGLAISRHLVEMMGGALDCDSRAGAGSTFWFDLDLPAAELRPEEARSEPEAAPDKAMRLLVADDHPTNLKVLSIIMEGAGIDVTCVENGLQAVQAHAADSFDLILMDIQMPVLDGLTATAQIRARETRMGMPRTPIVMLTANAQAEHVEAGRLAGADGHLTKPITPTSLFQAIADATEARPGDAASPPGSASRAA